MARLYELAGEEAERRFSPCCRRIRWILGMNMAGVGRMIGRRAGSGRGVTATIGKGSGSVATRGDPVPSWKRRGA
ncbi:MAG: hypothetical protein M0002_14120 [Rhodospirillales bacterium]|nr:hypothetical protein [Rhodospirillales bacterium]